MSGKSLFYTVTVCLLSICALPFAAEESDGIAACEAFCVDFGEVCTVCIFCDCGSYTGCGEHIEEAFSDAADKCPRDIYLGKTSLYAVSGSADAKALCEFLVDDGEIRLSAPIVICDVNAADAYKAYGSDICSAVKKAGLSKEARLLRFIENTVDGKDISVRLNTSEGVPVCALKK